MVPYIPSRNKTNLIYGNAPNYSVLCSLRLQFEKIHILNEQFMKEWYSKSYFSWHGVNVHIVPLIRINQYLWFLTKCFFLNSDWFENKWGSSDWGFISSRLHCICIKYRLSVVSSQLSESFMGLELIKMPKWISFTEVGSCKVVNWGRLNLLDLGIIKLLLALNVCFAD